MATLGPPHTPQRLSPAAPAPPAALASQSRAAELLIAAAAHRIKVEAGALAGGRAAAAAVHGGDGGGLDNDGGTIRARSSSSSSSSVLGAPLVRSRSQVTKSVPCLRNCTRLPHPAGSTCEKIALETGPRADCENILRSAKIISPYHTHKHPSAPQPPLSAPAHRPPRP